MEIWVNLKDIMIKSLLVFRVKRKMKKIKYLKSIIMKYTCMNN